MDYALPNISNDLSGRVALVTGTTSGLGRRFAEVIAASGAKVVVTGRRIDRLEALIIAVNQETDFSENTYLATMRHIRALKRAKVHLKDALAEWLMRLVTSLFPFGA